MEAIFSKTNFMVKNYIEISKPRSALLLYFTGLSAIIIASSIYGFNFIKIILIAIAIILGTMGSNSITNFIDRETDSIMGRTKIRAIPKERTKPARNALIYGSILVITAIIIASIINYWSAFFLLLGFFDSAIIYNLFTKRKSPFGVVFGSPAGGLPVIIGWIAIAGKIDLLAFFYFYLLLSGLLYIYGA